MSTASPPPRARRARRGFALVAAGATAIAGSALALAPGSGVASSHREAPLIKNDPQADNTDVYAFVSPDKPDTVTLIANWIPLEEPNGGPNFYPFSPDAHYNIKIDNNGDGKPDITYQWTFKTDDKRGLDTFLYNNGPVNSLDDATLLVKQTYDLAKIDGAGKSTTVVSNGKVAPSDAGPASMPNYATLRDQAITPVQGGGKTYAGQADDPFFLDLRVFDLLYGGNLSETGQDTLNGYNVNTIALQVPAKELVLNGDTSKNPVIGIWSTTDRPAMQTRKADGSQSFDGDFVQVSRLGNPLVNEVVIPAGLKDAFNALPPEKDHTVQPAVDRVKDPEVPKLIEKIYGIKAPPTPRNDLVEIFLTGVCKACGPIKADLNSQQLNADVKKDAFVPAEELRLNVGVKPTANPNRLGVLAGDLAGFPNGRRLADDIVDIELQAVEGAAQSGKLVDALAKGDGVNNNDVAFGSAFPYVALPHNQSVNRSASGSGRGGSGGSGGGSAPSGGANTGAGGTASSTSGLPALPVGVGLAGIVLAGTGVALLRRRTA